MTEYVMFGLISAIATNVSSLLSLVANELAKLEVDVRLMASPKNIFAFSVKIFSINSNVYELPCFCNSASTYLRQELILDRCSILVVKVSMFEEFTFVQVVAQNYIVQNAFHDKHKPALHIVGK